MDAPELPELLTFVLQQGNEKFLVEIFDDVGMGIGVVANERLLNRVIDQIGILADKGIPGGFLTPQAAINERFFLLGHCLTTGGV